MKIAIGLALLMIIAATGIVQAAPLVLSGYVNDPFNAALKGSDLGSPLFGDEWEIANNVAIYDITIAAAGSVGFLSKGVGQGGFEPYFTLFGGTGPSATFLGSNYDQAFYGSGGDFTLVFDLVPGLYTAAIAVFANMSFAENLGAGTLADGFIGLGVPDWIANYYYEVEVASDYSGAPIPEPSSWLLLLPGLALVWLRRRR